jgi:DAK2 domain fusion protein YloV
LTKVDQLSADVPVASEKWLQCNGRQLAKMAQAGLIWLERNRDHVNSLNVFPVPDGDTGTNMLLTMRSACARVADNEETGVGKVAAAIAQGALMGARGNSGVILSQIWRGLASGLAGKDVFNAPILAQALQLASDTAYKGVMRPVEGTILTVIREGAAEAADAARKSDDLRFLLERVLERCQQALERTPELLPILRQAGVVDSGGQGLVYILEGMMRYVQGNLLLGVPQPDTVSGDLTFPASQVTSEPRTAQELAAPEGGLLEFPYDVQFILSGRNLDVGEVRNRIDAMGDSTVVVGDANTIKVHIHVRDPGQPLSYGISLGKLSDVVVENMQTQMEDIVQGGRSSENDVPALEVEPGQVAAVVVASGSGLIDIFKSLGAAYVVNGGQTNNPSTEELFQAIESVPTERVIVLPNNKNIFLAAEAARDLSSKDVAVVHSRSIPQGITALMAMNPDGEVPANAETMEQMLSHVRTGEITRATRTVELDGVKVKKGAIIGLVDGRLCSSGYDVDVVMTDILARMDVQNCALVTVYYGADVVEADATRLVAQIVGLYPHLEVELVEGGQAHYFYILGAE